MYKCIVYVCICIIYSVCMDFCMYMYVRYVCSELIKLQDYF